MNRRHFLNRGFALTAGGIFVPRILRAQLSDPAFVSSLTNPTVDAGGGYTPNAVNFDGSTYMTRATNFTGKADSAVLLSSFWFKMGATGVAQRFWCTRNNNSRVALLSSNAIQFVFRGVVTNPAVSYTTAATFSINGLWNHFAISFDTSNVANRHVYINGSADAGTWAAFANESLDLDSAPEAVGAVSDGTNKFTGCLSELYWTTQYLDLSVAGNLAKFISGGSPVSLGSDGSLPTGTAPLCYLKGAAAGYTVNSGSGGDYSSVTGTLTDCSTSP